MVAENVPPVRQPSSLPDSPTLELLTTHLPDVLVDTLDLSLIHI